MWENQSPKGTRWGMSLAALKAVLMAESMAGQTAALKAGHLAAPRVDRMAGWRACLKAYQTRSAFHSVGMLASLRQMASPKADCWAFLKWRGSSTAFCWVGRRAARSANPNLKDFPRADCWGQH